MSEASGRPPWVWADLPPEEHRWRWHGLVQWVEWLEQAGAAAMVGSVYRPALPVSQLQMMPPGYAWLFYRSDPPRQVETRPAGLVPEFQRLSGFHPDPEGAR